MANEHDSRAAAFGKAREVGRTLAHLRYRAGRAGELIGIHRLNRINHRDMGLELTQGGDDFL